MHHFIGETLYSAGNRQRHFSEYLSFKIDHPVVMIVQTYILFAIPQAARNIIDILISLYIKQYPVCFYTQ